MTMQFSYLTRILMVVDLLWDKFLLKLSWKHCGKLSLCFRRKHCLKDDVIVQVLVSRAFTFSSKHSTQSLQIILRTKLPLEGHRYTLAGSPSNLFTSDKISSQSIISPYNHSGSIMECQFSHRHFLNSAGF